MYNSARLALMPEYSGRAFFILRCRQPCQLPFEAVALACERDWRLLFDKLDLRLERGEMLQISGPNGSGKTSLLRLLSGLMQPTSGEVRLQAAAGCPAWRIGAQPVVDRSCSRNQGAADCGRKSHLALRSASTRGPRRDLASPCRGRTAGLRRRALSHPVRRSAASRRPGTVVSRRRLCGSSMNPSPRSTSMAWRSWNGIWQPIASRAGWSC